MNDNSGKGNAAKDSKLVLIYAERITHPDGRVEMRHIRTLEPSAEATAVEATKITGLSKRQIQHLCDTGAFKTARKKSPNRGSQWLIARWELLSLKAPPSE